MIHETGRPGSLDPDAQFLHLTYCIQNRWRGEQCRYTITNAMNAERPTTCSTKSARSSRMLSVPPAVQRSIPGCCPPPASAWVTISPKHLRVPMAGAAPDPVGW